MAYYRNDKNIGLALEQYGEHDWIDLEVTAKYATGLVIDAGANIGTHSLVYAKTATRVLAFEPQFFVYKLLVMNTVFNQADNVTPLWAALGAENGMVHIPSFSPDSDQFFGSANVGEGDDIVQQHTIDSLNLTRVSFMKVDVECAMLNVLAGARATILRDHPVLYVENNFGEQVNEVLTGWLREWGYRWEEIIVPAYPQDNYLNNPIDIYVPGTLNKNLLCFPKEQ